MSLLNHFQDSTQVQINLKAPTASSSSSVTSANNSSSNLPKWLQSGPRRPIKHMSERNVIFPFLVSLFSFTVVLIVGAPLMIVSTVILLPIAVFVRFTLNNIKLRCSTGCRRLPTTTSVTNLAANDAIWLHPNPFGANSACSLLFFDKGLTLDKVRDMIIGRLVTAEQRGKCLYPRFRQKIVPLTVGYLWADEDNFDVDNHVYSAPSLITDRVSLESYINELINRPFKLTDRSPWEVQFVAKYGNVDDVVLIVRTHHCFSDAISLIKILTRGLSDNNSAVLNCYKPRCGGTTFPLNICRALIIGPLTFMSWLFCSNRDYNLLNHGQKLYGAKMVAWSGDISLPKVIRIKQVSRSTLNDVILAALSGSLRNVFQSKGVIRPSKLKANLSFDLRFESRSSSKTVRMGSKFALVNLSLPLHIEGSIPRLWAVRSSMDQLKSSADPVSMWGGTALIETFLPQCLSRRILGTVWSKASLTINNIPGPEYNVYAMTTKLKSIVCMIPPRDGVPLSITITTNAKVLKIGIMTDSGTISDPNSIIDGFIYQIEVMARLLASRRIPGEHRRKSSFIFDLSHLDQGPSTEEIQKELHKIQKEIHEFGLKLAEVSQNSSFNYSDGQMAGISPQEAVLRLKMSELKQEFSNLLAQLRRRKSVVQGSFIIDEDEDLDGELRRPRRRAVSVPSRKSSLTATTSTARPLTTPSTSYQAAIAASTSHVDDCT
ncbi:hypothetical protein CHUAL_006837 [Chamberlinius hualienensis]